MQSLHSGFTSFHVSDGFRRYTGSTLPFNNGEARRFQTNQLTVRFISNEWDQEKGVVFYFYAGETCVVHIVEFPLA